MSVIGTAVYVPFMPVFGADYLMDQTAAYNGKAIWDQIAAIRQRRDVIDDMNLLPADFANSQVHIEERTCNTPKVSMPATRG